MEAPTPGITSLSLSSSSSSSKSMKIKFEGKKHFCQIQVIEDSIQAEITLDNKFKYKGNIFLEKIQSQIKAFLDYNIYEIYEEINQLNTNNFSIIKINNKYKLITYCYISRRKSIWEFNSRHRFFICLYYLSIYFKSGIFIYLSTSFFNSFFFFRIIWLMISGYLE